jgi:chromosomal replication initiator protein
MVDLHMAIRRARIGKKLMTRGIVSSELDVVPAHVAARMKSRTVRSPIATDLTAERRDRRMLDSFVCGPSNAHAYGVFRKIAAGEDVCGPIVIYGGPGVGKTHLMKALVDDINSSGRRVALYVNAIKEKSAAWKSADVLVVDNVQFSGVGLCRDIGSAIDKGIMVIAASASHPSDLVNDRIRSRMMEATALEIRPFDDELCRSLVLMRIASAATTNPPFEVADDVVDYIVGNVNRNGRAIDGTINGLIARSRSNNGIATMDMAEQSTVRSGDAARPSVDAIIDAVSMHYGVTRTDLLSARRTAALIVPRHVAMYLAKMLTTRSFPEIGRRFGGRDHTTIMHGARKIERMIADDARLAADVDAIKNRITRMS